MKLKIIGGITLDYEMWIDEHNDSSGVIAEVVDNLDGGVIVFEQTKRTSKQNITARSLDSGWQKPATKDAIIALANSSLGQTISVTDSDDNVYDVRFRHEQVGGAVQFDRLTDAKLVEWYHGTIYLAKV